MVVRRSNILGYSALCLLAASGACDPDFDRLTKDTGQMSGGVGGTGGRGGNTGGTPQSGTGGASEGGSEAGAGGNRQGGTGNGTGGKSQGGNGQGGSGKSASGGVGEAGTPTQTGEGGAAGSETGGDAGAGGSGEECPTITPTETPPLLRYDFEDASGTVITDSTDGEHHGTLVGGRWVLDAHEARGLEFFEEDQYATLPANIVSELEAMTVTAWVRLAANDAGSTLFDFGSDATNHIYLKTNAGSGTRFGAVIGGTDQGVTSARTLPLGVWQHVAAVVSQGKAILYLNGLEMARSNVTFKPSGLGKVTDNWLGRSHDGDADLAGTVDDFRIYDRGLSPDQISALSTPDYLYFKFDETCGTRTRDASSRALVGTLPKGGTWTAGRVGGALELNGTDQYVILPQGIVEDCSDFTLAFWAQRSRSTAISEHIIDFGQNQRTFLYVTPQSRGAGSARFAIKLNGNENDATAEQTLTSTTALPLGLWQHIAVVLDDGVGTLYVNGTQYDSRAISLKPSALGSTLVNTIGRSQYYNATLGPDPFYAGRIDDLRIACRAFSSNEVGIVALVQ